MPTYVSRNAIAQFSTSGVLGAVFVDGVRGTLASGGTLLGFLPNVGTSIDYVPSAGSVSVNVALDFYADQSFPGSYGAKPASGIAFAVQYLSLTSSGQIGLQRNDSWIVS